MLGRRGDKRHSDTLLDLAKTEVIHIRASRRSVSYTRKMKGGRALVDKLGELSLIFLIDNTDKELYTVIFRLFYCHGSVPPLPYIWYKRYCGERHGRTRNQ